MKKKIIVIVVLLMIILGLGGFYFFGFYEKLPDNKKSQVANLYEFDIFNKGDGIQATLIKDKYLYYVTALYKKDGLVANYKIIKYNIFKEKTEKTININATNLFDIQLISKNNNIIMISKYFDSIFIFDDDLNLIKKIGKDDALDEDNAIDMNGIYNDKSLFVKESSIYIDQQLDKTIEKECGNIDSILYDDDNTLLYFVDYNTKLSCLYNLSNKKTIHTESDKLQLFDDGYLFYYFYNNKISTLIKGNTSDYYINDSIETLSLDVNNKGNLVLTYNSNNNKLTIYDLNNKKIKYQLDLKLDDSSYVDDLVIDKYAYFTVYKDETMKFYIWDYSKEKKLNKDMISFNETDYKFNNIELVNELNKKYGINIYIYDDSSRYFPDFYSVASSDDIKINETLIKLKKLLGNFDKKFFSSFKYNKANGIKIYLTKKLGPSNTEDQISNPAGYSILYDNDYIIAVDITSDSFEQNMCHEMMHSIESNIYEFFYNNKITRDPFSNWSSLNPNGFDYQYSYVEEADFSYTPGSENTVYFVDYYAHTFPTEDRARIFEYLCAPKEDNLLLKYKNLKKKANRLKTIIVDSYPSIKDSNLFDIIK